MLRVATMSKKGTVVYIVMTTIDFLAALTCLLVGLIFVRPIDSPAPFAIPLIIVGAVLSFIMVFLIMLTSLSSNYVEKKMTEEEKERIRQKYHFHD